MKLIKGILAIAIISVIAVSCNETKKGAEKDLKQAVEKVEKSTDKVVESGKEIAIAMSECDGNCVKDGKSCDGSCKKEMAHTCAKDAACMKSGTCDGSCKEMKAHKCAEDAACMKSGKCDGSCKA